MLSSITPPTLITTNIAFAVFNMYARVKIFDRTRGGYYFIAQPLTAVRTIQMT